MKCNQICKWNSNAGCVKPYGVPCILENVSPTDKKATNADRIRSMTDEKLAELIDRETDSCAPTGDCAKMSKDCKACWLEWLQQPAEECND